MDLTIIIVIIILSCLLNFLIRIYVKLSMVLNTIFLLGIILLVDSILLKVIFVAEMFGEIPIMMKLLIIIISILPIFFLKEYILHTIRILYFWINKNKLLESEHIEKGVIQGIKSYGLSPHGKDGLYLIVNLNGERIKSLPFNYNQGSKVIKTTFKINYSDNKFNKGRKEEVLDDMTQLYNVGDKIDVIIYNNKKYVKLKDMR